MTSSVILNFHGWEIQIKTADPKCVGCLEFLREDFKVFVSPASRGEFHALFELQVGASGPVPGGSLPLFKTRMCRVYGFGPDRTCDYGDGSRVTATEEGARRFLVVSPDPDELYEIVFMAVLSVAGEMLDRSGFHRVHALGLEARGSGIVLILPQGGGKSALASLLKSEGVKIYSDESPLLRQGKIYPFPLRIALRSQAVEGLGLPRRGRVFRRKLFEAKEVFPFPEEKTAVPAPLKFILTGVPVTSIASIRRGSAVSSLASLTGSMVVGLGVAQMAEFMLRLNALPALSLIGVSRAREAVQCVIQARSYIFRFTRDARENAAVLDDFLSSLRPGDS